MLTPLGKRIIVKPIEVKHGALLITGVKPTQFHVIAIGDEVTKVKLGDTVYVSQQFGSEIEHEKEKFIVLEETFILAKVD